MPYYTKDPKRDPNFGNHPYRAYLGLDEPTYLFKDLCKEIMIRNPEKEERFCRVRVELEVFGGVCGLCPDPREDLQSRSANLGPYSTQGTL